MKRLTFDLNFRPHYEESINGSTLVLVLRDGDSLTVADVQEALKQWIESGHYHMALIWAERKRGK